MKEKFNNHTFVICAYKESEYLEECIKSIKNQEMESNIIMVTSTENDYIKNKAEKFNIPLYINNGKSGIGPDWNFGVGQAKTDYVTIIHQDDLYDKKYLKEIKENIDKKGEFVIAFTDYNEIKNGEVIPETKNLKIKKILLTPVKFFPKSKFCKRLSLSFGSPICCPSVTLNTKIVGKQPYKIGMKCDLDWDTWIDFIKYKGRYTYINKPLMYHRIHEESETSALIENNVRLDEDFEILCQLWPKWIAKIIMHFYKNAIITNEIKK